MIHYRGHQMRHYLARAVPVTRLLPMRGFTPRRVLFCIPGGVSAHLIHHLSLALVIGSVFLITTCKNFPITTRAHSDIPILSIYRALLDSLLLSREFLPLMIRPRGGGLRRRFGSKVRPPSCGPLFTTKLPHAKPQICHISVLCRK